MGMTTILAILALVTQPQAITREHLKVEGWSVEINTALLKNDREGIETTMKLLVGQLKTIKRLVPKPAVAKLQRVTLWFSPEYPGVRPTAEYHPGAQWLRENGRDPIMAKGVEFTNVRTFEAEIKRMPVLVLHELAHSYHDQVLGFDNLEIEAAYQKAKAGGKYDLVKRWIGTKFADKTERAYAMTNAQEYFAEGTEAYFAKNDFFPFDRKELEETDPGLCKLMKEVWSKS